MTVSGSELAPRLLDLLRIPHRVLAADTIEADLAWTVETMDRAMQPVALLVPPGVVEIGKAGHGAPGRARPVARDATTPANARHVGTPTPPVLTPRLSRLDAIAAARKALGREPLIHANGYMCRESFSLGDRPENFYMIGSMGLASAIGLGLSLADRDTPAGGLAGDRELL